jgi:membrane protein implicated in regulation of membrane protease activity
MTWWAWMVLGAVILGAELFAIDAQFYLVFLGLSAALVGAASLAGIDMAESTQWLAFALLSLAFFFTFRRALYGKIRGGAPGFQESISGDTVTVSGDLAPGAEGRAELRGTEWTIRNVSADTIISGTRAKVVKTDGVILHVEAD